MSVVETVDEMVARLQSLEESLPTSDGVHWFNRLLLEVTLPIREVLSHAHLEASPFLERLDVFIGNAYFEALAAARGGDGKVPRAWAPLFDARHDPRIAPLQFALAGMNAHINHDLAIGTVVTCSGLGMGPGPAQQHDFQAVNAVVTETEARVKRWLLTGAVKKLDHLVAPADDLAAIWSLGRARAAAWVRAQVLWQLRDLSDLSAAWIAVNDRATELAGRALVLPLPQATTRVSR